MFGAIYIAHEGYNRKVRGAGTMKAAYPWVGYALKAAISHRKAAPRTSSSQMTQKEKLQKPYNRWDELACEVSRRIIIATVELETEQYVQALRHP